jgi:Fic family protein
MTNREFFTNIANGTITETEKEFALAAIAKLDATNEKRKNKTSPKEAEKQAADAVVREQIAGVLTSDPQTAADIAVAVGISTQKASAQLRKLVADGVAIATDIKVPKKGTCKGYSLAPVGETAGEDVAEG